MKRPNVIYVVPDEFRQSSMGFLKCDPVITPNIDRFAQEGLVLENAVSSFPVCSPYRGQLFTGLYPYSNGVIGNCNSTTAACGVYLPRNRTCLPDVFSQAGYDCGYIGKWHLDTPDPADYPYLEPMRGDGRVWDAYTAPEHRHGFNFWHSYGCNDQHFKPHYWHNEAKVEEVQEIREWSPIHEADVAVQYIENAGGVMRDKDKPFLLFWAPNPPHMPFDQVPQKYKDLYQGESSDTLLTCPNKLQDPMPAEIPAEFHPKAEENRRTAIENVQNYFAAVSGIDEQFGRILDAVDRAGLKEDTIVIFTSDHGEMMGSHSLMYKALWYDECYKVPFIIRYPGRIEKGVQDFFLNPPDIMPTLLELCGLEDRIPNDLEGHSTASALLGGDASNSREGYFINCSVNARGLRTKEYTFAVVRDRHEKEQYVLYDMKQDPYQMCNIADLHPELVKQFRGRLQVWLEKTKDIWLR